MLCATDSPRVASRMSQPSELQFAPASAVKLDPKRPPRLRMPSASYGACDWFATRC